MPIKVEVFVDTDVFEAINAELKRVPALAKNVVTTAVRRSRKRIRQQIVEPDRLPNLPFVWSFDPAANARARRWYFANKVPPGSRGGRYQRTGDLVKSFDITTLRSDDSDLIMLDTDASGAEYVVGDRQVPSHAQTPWFQIDEIALRESELLTDELIDLWFTLVDPFAGIPT